jgi:tight adherence protein B
MNDTAAELFILVAVLGSGVCFGFVLWRALQNPFQRYEERYLQSASGKLDQMFIFIPAKNLLYIKFSAALILFLAILFIGAGVEFLIVRYVLAGTGALAGFIVPEWILKIMEQKRLEKFEFQLMEGLQNLANSLKAGFTFNQSLDLLVKEGEQPLSQEFDLVLKEARLGLPLEQALLNLTKRMESEDLDLVVSSVILTRELGGNLANIFERLAYTIRERMKLKGKISSLTSQGRMQGWVVGLMPIFMGVVLWFVSPAMMVGFFGSLLGWGLIAVMLILEVMGALFIKKIITINI